MEGFGFGFELGNDPRSQVQSEPGMGTHDYIICRHVFNRGYDVFVGYRGGCFAPPPVQYVRDEIHTAEAAAEAAEAAA